MKKLIVAMIAVFALSSFALADDMDAPVNDTTAPQAETQEAPVQQEVKVEHQEATKKAKKAKKRSKKQMKKMETEGSAE